MFGEEHPWFAHQALSLHQLDPQMLAAVLRGPAYVLDDYDARDMLPSITCPVLLLQADPRHGAVLLADEVQQAISRLPRAEALQIEGIGHPLHSSHPREVLEAISPFLRKIQRGSV
jgi:pimeloyl-ACP methyl ester carboxylesterase